ncbi:MAG: hypothetical protein GXO19_00315 [Epsilonproteobacteria bacterium]|nr:hypothetical protein [Campylobacterota bacterium]NPA56155.1 hypothetical protein [Campylobacterota bacterium]
MKTSVGKDTVRDILEGLSKRRPLFHSEADFQHAFACEIDRKLGEVDIRLEKRFIVREMGEIYVDIVLLSKVDNNVAIEIKYSTKKLEVEVNGEEFALKNHSSLDTRRYDFLLDMYRLERLNRINRIARGYAIFLTNDPGYWKEPRKKNAKDRDFRIHHGRKIEPNRALQWAPDTSESTKKGRKRPLEFGVRYLLEWETYSRSTGDEFKYLLVEVGNVKNEERE